MAHLGALIDILQEHYILRHADQQHWVVRATQEEFCVRAFTTSVAHLLQLTTKLLLGNTRYCDDVFRSTLVIADLSHLELLLLSG